MASPPQPLELKGSRILMVDDDPVNSVVIAGFMATEDYVVCEASSGEEALALYESFRPDLILLDVTLPGIDGYETCRELQRRHGAASPPVIFLTSRASSQDIVAGFTAGGVDYITKPASQKEALARIRAHLSNRLLVAQLAMSNQRKNQVLGMAAHDLRNPLGSISGLTELLCEGAFGKLTTAQVEVLRRVHDESQSMLTLVNELLDVATIETGVLQLTIAPSNLTRVLEQSVYLNNINAARKNTRIILDATGQPIWARIDAGKIRQVIDNLLSNAVKYSPLGSVIRVGLLTEGANHMIAVVDQGPGVPQAERHRLFKEFGTLSVQSTGGEKSTGLGLAICRRIIEAHRGSIAADNLPGGGCRFSVTIPTTPCEDAVQEAPDRRDPVECPGG